MVIYFHFLIKLFSNSFYCNASSREYFEQKIKLILTTYFNDRLKTFFNIERHIMNFFFSSFRFKITQ